MCKEFGVQISRSMYYIDHLRWLKEVQVRKSEARQLEHDIRLSLSRCSHAQTNDLLQQDDKMEFETHETVMECTQLRLSFDVDCVGFSGVTN